MELPSGHKFEDVNGEEGDKIKNEFKGYTMGLIKLNPGDWILPKTFTKFAERIYNFEFRRSDVLIMTYMKCGTTWMQEIVWTMINNPNLDNPEAKVGINTRTPFIDTDMFLESTHLTPPPPDSPIIQDFQRTCPGKNPKDGFYLQMAEAIPDPRTIKTHLPLSLFESSLLDKTKVIYIARDPRDVLLSNYHHCRLFKAIDYQGSFQQFLDYFINDQLVYNPYWLHVKEAWEKRHHPNMYFVFYEDLKKDIMKELRKLNDFLSSNLDTDQLKKVADYTSFTKMKERDCVFASKESADVFYNPEVRKQHGGFFRKGESGGWKGDMTEEQKTNIEDWIERNFSPYGIRFSN